MESLKNNDNEVYTIIQNEFKRQKEGLELIIEWIISLKIDRKPYVPLLKILKN